MKALSFGRVATILFLAIAALHAYRLFDPFVVQIGSFTAPQSASWIGLSVAGALGVWGLRSSK